MYAIYLQYSDRYIVHIQILIWDICAVFVAKHITNKGIPNAVLPLLDEGVKNKLYNPNRDYGIPAASTCLSVLPLLAITSHPPTRGCDNPHRYPAAVLLLCRI